MNDHRSRSWYSVWSSDRVYNVCDTIIRLLMVEAELSASKERVQKLPLYGPDGG